MMMRRDRGSSPPAVERVEAAAFTVPTDTPESDGTLAWDSTTLVLVRASAGGRTGIGWTYAGPSAVQIVTGHLAGLVLGEVV